MTIMVPFRWLRGSEEAYILASHDHRGQQIDSIERFSVNTIKTK